jgi:hypothetical protein
MTLVGLDIDATRARAVSGPLAQVPLPLRLAEPHAELPLALSLEGRHVALGGAALTLCRRLPDAACMDFLPYLASDRQWRCGRHRLDAARAMAVVFEHLARVVGQVGAVAAALPAYLNAEQAATLARLADKARWRLAATAPTPLAAAMGGHEYLPWSGQALVLDVDGYALTWSALLLTDDSARLLASRPCKALGRAAWLTRLLDGVAGRCIRLSRRDPRESAEAEQYLYEQLLHMVEAPAGSPVGDLVIQSAQWYQRLSFSPADLVAFCAPMVAKALAEMNALLATTAGQGPVGAVLLTAAAASLPGLTAALHAALHRPEPAPATDEEDFGEGLLPEGPAVAGSVHVLPADAVARGAHELATRVHRRQLRPGRMDAVPLPPTRGTTPPKLHSGGVARPSRKRIPFPADGATGTGPAAASAPPPRRRTRPPTD